jgi:hypothetical protein
MQYTSIHPSSHGRPRYDQRLINTLSHSTGQMTGNEQDLQTFNTTVTRSVANVHCNTNPRKSMVPPGLKQVRATCTESAGRQTVWQLVDFRAEILLKSLRVTQMFKK